MYEVMLNLTVTDLSREPGVAAIGWECKCGRAQLMENRPGVHECECGCKVMIPLPERRDKEE